jgi:hypothetical protein
VSIVARFASALADVSEPGLAGAELLPVALARAAARMLPVDGAGLSLVPPGSDRVPLGGSSDEASLAERLQFTVGAGPCMAAQNSGEPVFALLEDLHRRWPALAHQFVSRTGYRAVVALPLSPGVLGRGAIDLYFYEQSAVPGLDVFEAMAVGELITSHLSEAAVWSTWAAERGPDWLHGPIARGRAAVWEATGKVSMALDVPAPAALDLMRAAAWTAERTVDDVAADLLTARMSPEELRSRPRGSGSSWS